MTHAARVAQILTLAAATVVATVHPSAQQTAPATASEITRAARGPSATTRELAKVLPGTRADALTTIQGNALSASDTALSKQIVRLRDARFGRIVDTTRTDESGLFAFRSLDPGSYIVELVGPDQTVVAASQIININAGESVSALVKLPFSGPPLAGVFGHSSSALIVTATAAAAGVLAVGVAGEDASPRR